MNTLIIGGEILKKKVQSVLIIRLHTSN